MGSQVGQNRVTLTVKSDSISALILTEELKTKGLGTNIVAKEMALDISNMCYRPDVTKHIPGIANISADALSRIVQPDAPTTIPKIFHNIPRDRLKPRGRALFKTVSS